MNWVEATSAAMLFVSSAIAGAVAVVAWQRRSAPGGWPLLIFQCGVILWTIPYAFHWLSQQPELQHFFLDMTYLGVVIVPTAFFAFVLQLTFRGGWLTRTRVALLLIEPLLTLFFLWTDPLFHLFHGQTVQVSTHNLIAGGFWFWLNIIYSYTLISISIILLVMAFLHTRFNYRRQARLILIGLLLPFIGSFINMSGLNILSGLDFTPILFGIMGILLSVTLSRYHLLKVVPIARYSLVEGMSDGVMVLDTKKQVVDINPSLVEQLNMPASCLIGGEICKIFADRPDVAEICCCTENRTTELHWSDNPPKWFDLQTNVLRGPDQEIVGWLLFWRNITAYKLAQEKLRQSEQRYSYLLDNAAFPVVVTSLIDDKVLYANQRTAELFELKGEVVGQPVPDYYVDPTERPLFIQALREKKIVNNFEVRLKSTSGKTIWALLSANIIEFDDQPAVFVAINNINDRRRVEADLRKLQRAVEQSANTIVITDTDGNIEFVNPAFEISSGYSIAEVLGKNPRILKSGVQRPEFYRHLWNTISSGQTWKGTFHNRRKDGVLYWESATISPVRDRNNRIISYLGVKEDITTRKEAEEEIRRVNLRLREQLEQNEQLRAILREQAIRDPLTNLYNRRYLDETLVREFARAERERYPISFLVVDIDRFKLFNDRYGHDAGDLVLNSLTKTLIDGTRAEDIVVRYGGEEILVMLIDASIETALERGESLRAAFEASQIEYKGDYLNATISVGAAVYPADGKNPEEVIRAADLAMYRAKADGRNCVRK